jgi:hypothetical protein
MDLTCQAFSPINSLFLEGQFTLGTNLAASSLNTLEGGPAPKPSRWRRPSSTKKLVASIFVALIVALSLLVVYGPDLLTLPLTDNSQLDYSMSGSLNNTTVSQSINGYANVTLSEFSKDGYSWGSHSSWSGFPGVEIENPQPFFWKTPPPGNLIGYDHVRTPFGEKSVGVWFDCDWGKFVFYDVGIESSVVYRMVVSSPEYHYCWTLKAANNTNLVGFDNHPRSLELHGLNHPSEEPSGFTAGSENGSEMYGGYSIVFGSLEVRAGERIRYKISGNLSDALIFDIGSIGRMHNTGAFQYNESLSREAGDPGETNLAADPGFYWFLFEFRSNGRVTFYWK